ncbi:MBL fold metallo-hydrolase [Salinicoccus halodurans]|uniref:Hydroxyacylglutathione hydrolase n=1 Tax=Salinicoccus halodurans TaxID=407035 RepID=A0A0F7HPB3_9STAP|nr:MBL fold metallo-hydrolase [Salinicoccus halodurans]AKG74988.1 Zn-dependent hydrolase [Salinicoccus halodurans]SFK67327.1 hydroxyacylglutathione hydrolase [Salinicoccus halodurans]
MFFKQFFDKKLAQTSYMVACQQTKEAIIIDPKRVVDEYEDVAEAEGFNITQVTETHIHADFASGLRDAAKRFNATAYVSDEGDETWKYEDMPEGTIFLKDGDIINVGHVELKVVHTPGHTPESISFVLTDRGGGSSEPMGIFTGDFLFVGDIGRPDLLEETANMEGTTEEGANAMFESLKKINDYPEFMQVWPGHGAGSACGKSLGAVPLSTLGYELRNNWVFDYDDKEEFIKELTSDQPEPPSYFAQMKKVNKEGLPEFKVKEVAVGTPDELPGQLFDLRSREEFRKGFKKGAINIPYNDKFLQFAGWYIDYDQPMTAIANPEDGKTLQEDLASIGYDSLQLIVPVEEAGRYFDDAYENVSSEEFITNFEDKNILDVRSASEYNNGNLENAHHLHFGQLDEKEVPFDENDAIYVHCQSGVRSAIAMSVLKARGYDNVVNIEDGYAGIAQALK